MIAKMLPLAVMLVAVLIPGMAFAQEVPPEDTLDVEFDFTAAEAAVLIIGVFGGLTTAYNGYRKNKVEQGDAFKWDSGKFFDRIIMGVLTSVPLAIGAAADIITLNIFTIIMIYLASLGGSELIMEIRGRTTKTK